MDPTSYIPALTDAFGPAGALVILALVWDTYTNRKSYKESQESRIRENKEHAEELYKTLTVINEFRSLLTHRSSDK